jgi:hypothetical protein
MKKLGSHESQKAKWSVVVLFENAEARDKAVAFCDRLVEQFLDGFVVEVNWWGFGDLLNHDAARQSAESAGMADVVLFAAGSTRLPFEARCWVEQWMKIRGDREGTLVDLCGEALESGEQHPEDSSAFLRKTAQRAGMDYFTGLPPDISRPIPDSFEAYVRRADQVTSILDDILHQPHHVDGLLLSTTDKP